MLLEEIYYRVKNKNMAGIEFIDAIVRRDESIRQDTIRLLNAQKTIATNQSNLVENGSHI